MTVKVNYETMAVCLLISFLFSFSVWKIDDASISKVAQVQATARAASDKASAVCRSDIDSINEAHTSIRQGFNLQARIAHDNVASIDRAIRLGLIPDNLRAYYHRVRRRQVHNEQKFLALRNAVVQLVPLC